MDTESTNKEGVACNIATSEAAAAAAATVSSNQSTMRSQSDPPHTTRQRQITYATAPRRPSPSPAMLLANTKNKTGRSHSGGGGSSTGLQTAARTIHQSLSQSIHNPLFPLTLSLLYRRTERTCSPIETGTYDQHAAPLPPIEILDPPPTAHLSLLCRGRSDRPKPARRLRPSLPRTAAVASVAAGPHARGRQRGSMAAPPPHCYPYSPRVALLGAPDGVGRRRAAARACGAVCVRDSFQDLRLVDHWHMVSSNVYGRGPGRMQVKSAGREFSGCVELIVPVESSGLHRDHYHTVGAIFDITKSEQSLCSKSRH